MSRPLVSGITDAEAALLAALLAALHDAGTQSAHQLYLATGQSRSQCTRLLVELIVQQRAQIVTERAGRVAAQYGITRAGSHALFKHQRAQEQQAREIVPARRDNLFERPALGANDLPRVFCRNNGNKNIQSRGFSC